MWTQVNEVKMVYLLELFHTSIASKIPKTKVIFLILSYKNATYLP